MFLLNENISMSNEDIIEILKSLETEDNKNSILIKRLVNYTDKSGKNVLMSVVSSNNIDLIDYILKFDVNLNQVVTSTGENVLFFCKNINVFKKLYELGANANQITKIDRTVLNSLSRKKLFNVELYQKIITDDVDINKIDMNNESVLTGSILNKKILELLLNNNVNLNGLDQSNFLYRLSYELNYYPKKQNIILDIFKILFKNGMIIQNETNFINILRLDSNNIDIIYDFIVPLNKYITDNMIILIYDKLCHESGMDRIKMANKLLRLGSYPKFYNKLKNSFREQFYIEFADYIKENPFYEDAEKFNL